MTSTRKKSKFSWKKSLFIISALLFLFSFFITLFLYPDLTSKGIISTGPLQELRTSLFTFINQLLHQQPDQQKWTLTQISIALALVTAGIGILFKKEIKPLLASTPEETESITTQKQFIKPAIIFILAIILTIAYPELEIQMRTLMTGTILLIASLEYLRLTGIKTKP
ncbi:MAG: hypothetical protein WCP97_02225 [bacterium]